MPYSLDGKLVVGISGRALFDLNEEHGVYEQQGLEAYKKFQREREQIPLKPGTGFPLVQALLAINKKLGEPVVEVIVISRNDGDSGLRIMNSIADHGLDITRASFCGGRKVHEYSNAYQCKLFLSAEDQDVCNVIAEGGAAGLVYQPPSGYQHDTNEVRIAFDGDAVIFSDEAERIYQEKGPEEFFDNETGKARIPLQPGPFKPFLQSLAALQAQFKQGDSPIRTAVVTARNAPAHERAILTLRDWGITVDEMHFLGGIEKTAVLQVFKPHIFFDDQPTHVFAASKDLPSAQVRYGVVGAKKAVASVRPARDAQQGHEETKAEKK
jgi:5'-nucleotidase